MSNSISFEKAISEIIKERTSVRTYNQNEIDKEKIVKIEEFIDNLKGPFNEKVRFKIINSKETLKGEKIGTYGIIKGANIFIAVAYENGEMALEEVGYEMEKLILFVTSLGLGTCWIGGTFNKSEFSKAMELKDNETLPIVTPIGRSEDKKRFIERAMKFFTKSKKRKEWYELFFLRDFSVPLTPVINLGYFKEVLENVRLAPSALNKQPWRIVKD
ncbi:nitroreductase family protein, partial [Clostridium saudiense]|nr:nitroreductase family protein [Clostridium saudiense]